jgi:hypothetical protein
MVLTYHMMNKINQMKRKKIWESNLDKMTTMFEGDKIE